MQYVVTGCQPTSLKVQTLFNVNNKCADNLLPSLKTSYLQLVRKDVHVCHKVHFGKLEGKVNIFKYDV